MAQVIVNYSATVSIGGGSNAYVYSQPDNNTTVGFYSNGDQIMLYADYASTAQNGRYHVGSTPGGWMSYMYISNIRANYQTVADPCTAPSTVTLNTATKVLTITGGAGGDLNTLAGFGVSWRDRTIGSDTWGAWSADQVSTARTVTVTAPAGKERQFRVRTRGSAGETYFSAYVQCATLLVGNTAPGTPAVTYPANNATTLSLTPAVVVTCPAEPEGDAMTLKRQVDGGSWQTVASVPGAGGVVRDRLPTLSAGTHTIRYTLTDTYGLESGAASVTLMASPPAWSRAIVTGSVIANQSISHRADILELRTAVNAQRAYYGLATMTLPGTVGNFSDWRPQMLALQTAIGSAFAVAGVAAPNWASVPGWPTAAVIQQIRSAVAMA